MFFRLQCIICVLFLLRVGFESFQSKCIACIYRIGDVNELKKFNFSTSFNFESLKVNISFTDRNFWLSKSYTVCLCQLFQLFSPNKLHCSTHWTSIYKLLEIKVLLLSKLPAKLPEGTEQAAAALQCPSSLFLFTIKGLKTNMRKLPINTIDLKNTREVLNSKCPSIRSNYR